jgi:hypothetical protein
VTLTAGRVVATSTTSKESDAVEILEKHDVPVKAGGLGRITIITSEILD